MRRLLRLGPAGHREGFTLVELLMTVAVLGLATGAVVLSMPDPRRALGEDAERFAARLQVAQEEAILSNRMIAVEVSSLGYDFSSYDGQAWSSLDEGPLGRQDWGEGVLVTTEPSSRMTFDPTGIADPAMILLQREGRSIRVGIDGAGEVTVHD